MENESRNYEKEAAKSEIQGELNALRFLLESLEDSENKFRKKLEENLSEEEVENFICDMRRALSKLNDEYTYSIDEEDAWGEAERNK